MLKKGIRVERNGKQKKKKNIKIANEARQEPRTIGDGRKRQLKLIDDEKDQEMVEGG